MSLGKAAIRAVPLLIWAMGAAHADSPADANDEIGRGVARISLLQGDVSVKRGDTGEWVAAAINAPLVVEDRMLTGTGSKAEIQFDYANFLRLSYDTEVRLAELENKRYIVQVARGTTTFRVLRDSDSDVEISTPSVSVRPLKRGEYRVTVREDGSSEITVRSGEAEVFTPKGAERLRSGKTMIARGTAADPEFQFVRALEEDDWDRWNERRDRDLLRSNSYRYMSRDIYGAEDLDGYGSWVHVAPYGHVWTPRVSVGWAPYRFGRWVWVDWYGWTWVSHDPWGWAPYHYGRWFYHQSRWCWYPGAIHSRTYWRPGLVAFFGFGRGGVGVGFGRVGWVPLGPYEPYHPWYGRRYYAGYRTRGYVDNSVNIVNNVNITNIYRNSRVNHAVSAVDYNDFGRGRGNSIRVSPDEYSRASLMRGVVPVAPGRESLRMSDREVRSANLSRGSANDRFFSRRSPAPVDRVSFEDQRRSVDELSRRSFRTSEEVAGGGGRVGAGQDRGVRQADGVQRSADAAQSERRVDAAQSRSDSGWRRVGEQPSRTDAAGGRAADQQNGWRRFGDPSRGARQDGAAGSSRLDQQGSSLDRGSREQRSQDSSSREGDSRESRSGGESRVQSDPSRLPDAGSSSRSSDSSDGWRRFGDPGRTSDGGFSRRGVDQDSGRLNRDSGRLNSDESNSRGSDSSFGRRESRGDGTWRRLGESGGGSDSAEPRGRSQERSDPGSGRLGRGDSSRSESRSEPIRISPPIVRERESPRSDSGSGRLNNFGGGSGRSGGFDSGSRGGGGGDGGGMRGGGGASAPRSTGDGGGGRSSGSGGGGRSGGGESRGGGGRSR